MAITEFPGLHIDNFRAGDTEPSLCLLTHMHSDHLNGLERLSYHSPPVYCSAATRAMVLNLRHNNGDGQLKYNHLRKEVGGIEVLKVLTSGVSHKLVCQNRFVNVTPIDIVHCPGAVMYLIDDGDKAILFTGDIRCEKWHVNQLAHHPSLMPFTLGDRSITLYVDSTFEQHDNPQKSYEENFHGIRQLVEAVTKVPTYPVSTHFALVASTTGYENVLIALALKLKTKVHMDSYWYHLYLAAADSCPQARQLVEMATVACTENSRVHFCRKGHCENRDGTLTIYLSPRATMNSSDMTERNQTLDIRDFPGGTYTDQTLFVHGITGIRYILAEDGHTLLPGHIYFNFSRHASQPELSEFKAIFANVTQVKSLQGDPVAMLDNSSTSELKIHKKKAWSRPPISKPARKRQSTQASSSGSHADILDFLNQQARDESSLSTPPTTPKKVSPTGVDSNLGSVDSVDLNVSFAASIASLSSMASQTPSPQLTEDITQAVEGVTCISEDLVHTVTQKDSLETRLRQNITEWFEIDFDWRKTPVYGYK